MATNIDENMRNMCSVVDAVDFIAHYGDKLTSAEKGNIVDPLTLSRSLFRRLLGKLFSGFEVRKNSDHYSIRCNDLEIYQALRVFNAFNNSGYSDKLDPQITVQLRSVADPLQAFFGSFSGSQISYKFRDESRFFIYVDYMPYTHSRRSDFSDSGIFESHSMRARFTRLTRMFDQIKDLKPTPMSTKYVNFITRFGDWSLGYLPRQFGRGSVTEEFMDYALAAPVGQSLASIGQQYMLMKNPPQVAEPVAPVPPPPRPRAANEASDEAQARFRSALQRVSGQPQSETEPEEVNPMQSAFDTALQRIVASGRADERFLRLRLDESEANQLLNAIDAPMASRRYSPYSPGSSLIGETFVNDMEYIRLLAVLSHSQSTSMFRSTNQDVFDDFDNERQGIYFTVEGAIITYYVYGSNELLLTTGNYDEALTLYTGRYGRPEEIRYLEGI